MYTVYCDTLQILKKEENVMKTYFAEPMVEVVKFAVEDVITESTGSTETTIPALMPPCL